MLLLKLPNILFLFLEQEDSNRKRIIEDLSCLNAFYLKEQRNFNRTYYCFISCLSVNQCIWPFTRKFGGWDRHLIWDRFPEIGYGYKDFFPFCCEDLAVRFEGIIIRLSLCKKVRGCLPKFVLNYSFWWRWCWNSKQKNDPKYGD